MAVGEAASVLASAIAMKPSRGVECFCRFLADGNENSEEGDIREDRRLGHSDFSVVFLEANASLRAPMSLDAFSKLSPRATSQPSTSCSSRWSGPTQSRRPLRASVSLLTPTSSPPSLSWLTTRNPTWKPRRSLGSSVPDHGHFRVSGTGAGPSPRFARLTDLSARGPCAPRLARMPCRSPHPGRCFCEWNKTWKAVSCNGNLA